MACEDGAVTCAICQEETVEDEYAHLKDDEEFENFDKDKAKGSRQGQQKTSPGGKPPQQQTLKITDVSIILCRLRFQRCYFALTLQVPAHLVNNWTNFQLEMVIILALALYLLNYIYGKTKNHALATAWFETHRELLDNNFHIVGILECFRFLRHEL